MATTLSPSAFGTLLKGYRLAAGLTQEGLAARAGLSTRAVSDLERDGGRTPRLETVTLLAAALALPPDQRSALLAAARPPIDPATAAPEREPSPHNLPVPPTPLLGREREVAAALALLAQRPVRLLTLTGPGGVGKTRLGLQVATEARHAFADGAFLVSLAPLGASDLVAPSIAAALGVKERGGEPLVATLRAALRDRQLLLLLDNFEHLLAAAPLAAELLAAAAHLTVLVTSRSPLRLSGEQEFPVLPLAVPDPRHSLPLEELTRNSAVRLFVERAQGVQPDFTVTNDNARAVAAICRRLGGLPLAIELAAARVRALSPAQIAARLDDRFRLLTGGSRAAPPHQRTLRATIDWSHDLLTDSERVALRSLAAFAGGWTLEAAEAVCAGGEAGDPDRRTDRDDVVDLLAGLVEKSLVGVERESPGLQPADRQLPGPGGVRYRLPETLRQYAWERLAASGEADVIRDRHAAYYLGLAEQAEQELRGARHVAWAGRLEADLDNLRAALTWCEERGNVELGLQLAGASWNFWWLRGYANEGRERLRRALVAARADSSPVRKTATLARALHAAGALAAVEDAYADARGFLLESVALWRQLGNARAEGESLYWLAIVTFLPGDYAGARALLERSLALSGGASEDWLRVETFAWLGWVAIAEGAFDAARTALEEGVALGRRAGDPFALGWVLTWLGYVAIADGDLPRAQALVEEGRTLLHASETTNPLGFALAGLGLVADLTGRADALDLHREALRMLHEVPSRLGVIITLEFLACHAATRSSPAHALRLGGAAAGLRAALGSPVTITRPGRLVASLDRARQCLDEATAASAWSEGYAMTQDQAVAYALREDADG